LTPWINFRQLLSIVAIKPTALRVLAHRGLRIYAKREAMLAINSCVMVNSFKGNR